MQGKFISGELEMLVKQILYEDKRKKINFKDMLIKGLTNHLLTSLKYYLQIRRAEILSVFAFKSQNSKQSSILNSTAT